jgi:hypothetical protein
MEGEVGCGGVRAGEVNGDEDGGGGPAAAAAELEIGEQRDRGTEEEAG